MITSYSPIINRKIRGEIKMLFQRKKNNPTYQEYVTLLEEEKINKEIESIIGDFSKESGFYRRVLTEQIQLLELMSIELNGEGKERNALNGVEKVSSFGKIKVNKKATNLEERIKELDKSLPENTNLRLVFSRWKNALKANYKDDGLKESTIYSSKEEIDSFKGFFKKWLTLVDYITGNKNMDEDIDTIVKENLSFFVKTNYFGAEVSGVFMELGGALIAKEIKEVQGKLKELRNKRRLTKEEIKKEKEYIDRFFDLQNLLESYKEGNFFKIKYDELNQYKNVSLSVLKDAATYVKEEKNNLRAFNVLRGYISELAHTLALTKEYVRIITEREAKGIISEENGIIRIGKKTSGYSSDIKKSYN